MKKSGLSINVKISELLKKDKDLVERCNGDIYPLAANQDTAFPFIVHYRNTVTPTYTKCGRACDKVTFSVEIAATKYIESMELAEMVRADLELVNDDTLSDVMLTSTTEFFSMDAFVQRLDFEATIL